MIVHLCLGLFNLWMNIPADVTDDFTPITFEMQNLLKIFWKIA